jgi:hypothetical protein
VLRTFIASATTTAVLTAGCASSRPWPAHPVAISTPAFAAQGEVATIDVLPLDLQLWADPSYDGNLAELRSGTEVNIMNIALETLARRNYAVGAMIDWNGNFPGGNALSKDDLLATVGSLGRYGAATAEHPGQLPVPFLPARLGTSTGADATLYVGGWSYVARHHDSTGEQIAQGVMIGLLVITVVAIVALVASSSKSGSHSHGRSHGRSHGPSGGGGGGHVSDGGGHAGNHGGTHSGFTASRGVAHVHQGRSAVGGLVDAFGRTAIDVALSSPDWGEDPELPHEGGESQMYLEMTLVDNRTGLALWHAHQIFPASAASAAETARVARTMLSQLPDRVSPQATAAN